MKNQPRPFIAKPPIEVFFVLQPGSQLLDWASPAEALRIANQVSEAMGRPPRFKLHFVGPQAEAATSVGIEVQGIEPLPKEIADTSWLVLPGLTGEAFDAAEPHTQKTVAWLGTLGQVGPDFRLIAICSGAVLAAHAGLLKNRRATTHHHHLDELREAAPDCDVVANRIFVIDRGVYSSAGVTTGIDLMLHLIAETCGAPTAARVAQTLAAALRRGPNDPELSPFLDYRNHIHAALHRVQDAISAAPQEDWDVPRMAKFIGTSARHLTRLFVDHAGIPPLEYLRRIRLAVAQAALQSGHNVTHAAQLAGFNSDTQLRRAWHQFGLENTPSKT